VISSGAFQDVTNGYERRTDGLWLHTGRLIVRGGPVDLPDGAIGTAELADGAVTTAKLATNAAQQLIGQYQAVPTFTTTTVGVWTVTTVSTGSIACSGARCRIVCSGTAFHSVAGTQVTLGLMVDAVATYSMLAFAAPGVNYVVPFCFEVYHVPAAGNHTFALMLNNGATGTAGLFGNVFHTLFVSEEKR